jgi:hypothetical protein
MAKSGNYRRALSSKAANQLPDDLCGGACFDILLGKILDAGRPKLDPGKKNPARQAEADSASFGAIKIVSARVSEDALEQRARRTANISDVEVGHIRLGKWRCHI